jgi:DNA-binding LytR/AlgR family response regulator
MTLNCWILDDEPFALNLLEMYVNKTPFLNLTGKFNNAVSAMEQYEKGKVDIIFLDIQMPDVNGLEFAHMIENSYTRIVFTTAFSKYALDGYKVNAIDYLLKPFSYADFLVAAKKALTWFELITHKKDLPEKEENSSNGIFVKSDYKLIQIQYNDILYIEGLKDYVKIYTLNNPNPILTLMNLKTLEEDLPKDRFIRVHRSFIVQKNKIDSIKRNRISIGKNEIPIGETYRHNLIQGIEKS